MRQCVAKANLLWSRERVPNSMSWCPTRPAVAVLDGVGAEITVIARRHSNSLGKFGINLKHLPGPRMPHIINTEKARPFVTASAQSSPSSLSAPPPPNHERKQAKNMSSEVALELVRRDITEYSRLSAALYGATAEDLEKDPVFKNVHDRLYMTVELHGVLTIAGILPGEREWAQALVDTFVDLK